MVISKRFTFEAAHQLPNHAGKCRVLHGHSYAVEVAVSGEISRELGASDEGMVADFAVISDVFKTRVHAVCDHQYLNDVLPVPVTTAEWIAVWILKEMALGLLERDARGVKVETVRVYETATSYAEAARE